MTLAFAPERIEFWPIARLQPYAKNAKLHGTDQVAKLAASMAEFGWTVPCLVAEDGDACQPAAEDVRALAELLMPSGRGRGLDRIEMAPNNRLATLFNKATRGGNHPVPAIPVNSCGRVAPVRPGVAMSALPSPRRRGRACRAG